MKSNERSSGFKNKVASLVVIVRWEMKSNGCVEGVSGNLAKDNEYDKIKRPTEMQVSEQDQES
ncbi:hypothetical protein E2C01_081600 [Portunus trituberculatus]|uniref:Uncharacterized protein n=1 Tax=Portunus trituberculatus TaxID=210409 RepID=A0A5B7J2R6_PORTR|nr:hypothetical protein [Portunus trituberculatus]